MKRKLISAVTALCLVLTLAACGSKNTSVPSADVAAEQQYTAEGWSYSDGLTDDGLWSGVTAGDLVTLPEYKGISIAAADVAVTDDAVQSDIDSLLSQYATTEKITDRAVADGDTVNIDYVGSIGGVKFDGGSTNGAGTDVTIGTTQYIDDFLQQLIGHKPGETVNVEVTFPADYQATELAGKDAVFVTVINYIKGESVTPELTDSFVAENFSSRGWTTAAQLKAGVRDELTYNAYKSYINDYLVKNSTFGTVPDSMLEYQKKSMVHYCESTAEYYGVELSEFLQYYANVSTPNELLASYADSIDESAKLSLAIQAIAEKEGLTVSEQEISDYFAAEMPGEDYNDYVNYYGLPYVKWTVLSYSVMHLIRDNSVAA